MLTLLLLGSVSLQAAPAGGAPGDAPGGLSTPELIERAVGRAEIGRGRADLFLAYALGDFDRLPARFRSNVPWDGTLPLLHLRERLARGEPSADEEAALSVLASSSTTCSSLSSGSLPSETTSDHFWIQYQAPTGGLSIQDYRDALDTSWDTEVDAFGWAPPPIKSGTPHGKYHVRVVGNLTDGLYGFVSGGGTYAGNVTDNPATPWNELDAFASCMVLRNEYEEFSSPPLESLRSTVAHEFNHSIQFGYGAITGSNRPDDHLIEGSATWMEDEVFDEANDNYFFLWPAFSDSLGDYEEHLVPNSRYPYPYWVILRALTERYGTGIPGGGEQVMQDFWELTSQSASSNMLPALGSGLTSKGTTLADAYHAAAIALRFNRACNGIGYSYPHCLEEGPGYVAVQESPTIHSTIASVGNSVSSSVEDNYALRWVQLPTAGGPYTLTLQNQSATGGQIRGSVVCDTGSELRILALPSVVGPGLSDQIGSFSPSGCTSAFAVITNQSQTAPDPTSSTPQAFRLATTAASSVATLSVTRLGDVDGTVAADVGVLSCGAVCSANYAPGTEVTLTAVAPAGYGPIWGGACSGAAESCTVTMDQARAVSVTFGPLLSVSTTGLGQVTAPGLDCPTDCTEPYRVGQSVTLSAVPGLDFVLGEWGGGCSGSGDCTLTINEPVDVSATFLELFTLTSSVDGSGTGAIGFSDAGTDCGPGCRDYPDGTEVTLTAEPGDHSVFSEWSGDCTGSTCSLIMDGDKSVVAAFLAAFHIDIVVNGTGDGTVALEPSLEPCEESCARRGEAGSSVDLTATAASDSQFMGWGGDCAGTDPCSVSDDAQVTATFNDVVPPGVASVAVDSGVFQRDRTIQAAWGAVDAVEFDVRARRARWSGGFGSHSSWKEDTPDTGASFGGSAGYTYCLSALARDRGSNPSPEWSEETCTAIPVNDRSLTRKGGWSRKTGSGAYLGTFTKTRTKGAKLILDGVRAKRLAVLVTKCRGCGTIKVFLGSRFLRKISLASSTTRKNQLVSVATFSGVLTGRVRIKVVSDGKVVKVEGLGVSRV